MEADYYKAYFELEREHWWFRVREKIILDQLRSVLPAGRSLRILNVGAATGRSSEVLREFGEVHSIEYDGDCARLASEKTGMEIVQGDATALKFPDMSFDLVTAFDVIEHIENDGLAVSEMRRVLKPGGMIVITVPAFMSLWSRHDEINHHKRRYRKKEVIRLLSGFEILRAFYFNALLFPPIYAFRRISTLMPFLRTKAPASDFAAMDKSRLAGKVFRFIFSLERKLLRLMRFPFGVSVMLVGRK